MENAPPNAREGWALLEFNEAVRFLRWLFSFTPAQIHTGIAKGFARDVNKFIQIYDPFEG